MIRADFDYSLLMFSDTLKEIRKAAVQVHNNANHYLELSIPYSTHLDLVANYYKAYAPFSINEESFILPTYFAVYFHDSIEDARLNYNDVLSMAKNFMSEEYAILAADIVYALTDEKGKNRAERENDKYFHLLRNTKFASLVKCCDRAANISYSYENRNEKKFNMYKNEMADFLTNITNYTEAETLEAEYIVPEELIKLLEKFISLEI